MTNDKSNKPNDDVIICTDELRELVMIRRFNEVFHSDDHVYPIDTGDNRVLGIARDYKGKRMLGLFNFSPDEVWVDAWTGGSMMKPYGFRWILERYYSN